MKTIIASILCLIGLSVFAQQGVSMRSTNGAAYGTTDIRGGVLTNSTGNLNIGATNNINLFPGGTGKLILKLTDNGSYVEVDSHDGGPQNGQTQLGAGNIAGFFAGLGTFSFFGNQFNMDDGAGGTYSYQSGTATFSTPSGFVTVGNGSITSSNINGTTTIDGGNVTASGTIVSAGMGGNSALNGPNINADGNLTVGGAVTFPGIAVGGSALTYGYLTMSDDGTINATTDLSLGVNLSTSADTWVQINSLHPDYADGEAMDGFVMHDVTSGSTMLVTNFWEMATNSSSAGIYPIPLKVFPSGVPTNTFIYTGLTNIGNLATSLLIKINHTMPDTNYVPSVSFISAALGAGISSSYSSITTTNFTVNLSAGIAGGEPLRWSVIYSP